MSTLFGVDEYIFFDLTNVRPNDSPWRLL